MTGEQIRAARMMVGWKAAELAQAAGISVPTMQRLDATKGRVSGRFETIEAVRRALEGQGVQFIEEGQPAPGPGVALRRSA